jgi:hypothetical protein
MTAGAAKGLAAPVAVPTGPLTPAAERGGTAKVQRRAAAAPAAVPTRVLATTVAMAPKAASAAKLAMVPTMMVALALTAEKGRPAGGWGHAAAAPTATAALTSHSREAVVAA